jgi:hypothetical protein
MSFAMAITHDISKRDTPHSEYGVPAPVHHEYGPPPPAVQETYGPPPPVAVEVPHEEYGVPAVHDTADCPQDGRWIDDVSNVVWWAGATGGGAAVPLPHEEYGVPAAVAAPIPAATTVQPLPPHHEEYGLPAAVAVSVPEAPILQPLPAPVEVPTIISAPYPARSLIATHYGDPINTLPIITHHTFF